MFECAINKYTFWMGFIIGGFICIAIYELIQFIFLSVFGIRELKKEMKCENTISERKEPKL